MKIKELIEQLSKFDQELEVILSSDEEGNSFSPLADDFEDNQVYVKDYGVYWEELTEKLKEDGYTEEDSYFGEDAIRCIVLYPTR